MTGRMFASFWLEASVRKAGKRADRVSQSDSGVECLLSVENCSGFPSDVTVICRIPQSATGLCFKGCGNAWSAVAKDLQQRESRDLVEVLDLSRSRLGTESLHAKIEEYSDNHAGTMHKVTNTKNLIVTVTVR